MKFKVIYGYVPGLANEFYFKADSKEELESWLKDMHNKNILRIEKEYGRDSEDYKNEMIEFNGIRIEKLDDNFKLSKRKLGIYGWYICSVD